MSEGNASVQVACLQGEITIDLDKFQEALDKAQEMFEIFAENVDKDILINLNVDDDGLVDTVSEVREELESLKDLGLNDITLDVNNDEIEDLRDSINEIRENIEALNDSDVEIYTNADEVKSTDDTVERLKAIIDSINDKDINIRVNSDGVISATAQMKDLEDTEEETKEKSEGLAETLGTAIYAFQAVFQATKELAEGSLEQFAQMQMAGRIASNVFGSFGDNVKAFASTSMTSLGMSSGATMHYADMLGFALKAQGATEQSASKMSEQLIETADNMVLASGGSITMQQAVQTLTSAIAGQTYGLKSMGINITGVNKKWSPLKQSMYIMHQVISKVNKNFGSLSGNLDTTAGQMQIAQSTMEEFGESIGGILAPQLAEVNRILTHLYDTFEHLSPGVKKAIVIAGEAGVALLGLAATVAVVATAVKTLTDTFEDFELASLTNPIVLAIGGITVAVGLLYEAWKHNWDGMRGTIDDFGEDVKHVFEDVKNAFKELDLQKFSEMASNIFANLKLTMSNVFGGGLYLVEVFFHSFISLINPFFKDLNKVGIIIGEVVNNVVETVTGIISIFNLALGSLEPTLDRVGGFIAKFVSIRLKHLGDILNIIIGIIPRVGLEVQNVTSDIVEFLLPVVHLINNVTKAISHVTIFGHKLSSVLLDVATGIGGILLLRAGVIATMRGLANGFLSVVALGSNIMDVMSDMKDGIVGVVSKLPELIEGFKEFNGVQAITDALAQADPMTWIADAIVALIGVVVLLYEAWKHNWGGMRTDLEKIGSWIENKMKYLGEVFERWGKDIENTLHRVGKFFDNIGKGIGNFVKNSVHSIEQFGDKVKYVFTHFPEIVENEMKKFAKDVVRVFTVDIPHAIEDIPHILNVLAHDFMYGLGASLAIIVSFVANIVIDFIHLGEKIGEKLDEILHDIINWGHRMIDKGIEIGEKFVTETIHFFEQLPGRIWRWLVNAYHFTVDWGENMVHKAIETGRRFIDETINFFEQLPGRIWTWLSNAQNFVAQWGENMVHEAIDTGERFINETVNFFEQLPGRIETWLINAIYRIEAWCGEMASEGARAAEDFGHAIVSGVESIPGKMEQIGDWIVEGLWDGIKAKWAALENWCSSMADSFVNGFKKYLDIHSPSRRMYNEVGVWILPGIGQALEDGLPKLLNTVSKQVDLMVNHMQQKIREGVSNIKVPVPNDFNTLAISMNKAVSDLNVPWAIPTIHTNVSSNNSNDNYGFALSNPNKGLIGDTNITINALSSDPHEIGSVVRRQVNNIINGF